MHAVIVKASPKIANTEEARALYNEIRKFVQERGIKHVTILSGTLINPPPAANLYIAHQQPVEERSGRVCVTFLKQRQGEGRLISLSVPGGVNHPLDEVWFSETPEAKHHKGPPLTEDTAQLSENQKAAITTLCEKVKQFD